MQTKDVATRMQGSAEGRMPVPEIHGKNLFDEVLGILLIH